MYVMKIEYKKTSNGIITAGRGFGSDDCAVQFQAKMHGR